MLSYLYFVSITYGILYTLKLLDNLTIPITVCTPGDMTIYLRGEQFSTFFPTTWSTYSWVYVKICEHVGQMFSGVPSILEFWVWDSSNML